METTSFVLGIVTVVAVAMAVGMVWAFTQINKLRSELDSSIRDHQQEVADLYRNMADQDKVVEGLFDRVYSAMDSRFDKLENKVVKKQILNG